MVEAINLSAVMRFRVSVVADARCRYKRHYGVGVCKEHFYSDSGLICFFSGNGLNYGGNTRMIKPLHYIALQFNQMIKLQAR